MAKVNSKHIVINCPPNKGGSTPDNIGLLIEIDVKYDDTTDLPSQVLVKPVAPHEDNLYVASASSTSSGVVTITLAVAE